MTILENMTDVNKMNTVCFYFNAKIITLAIPSECPLSQCADNMSIISNNMSKNIRELLYHKLKKKMAPSY